MADATLPVEDALERLYSAPLAEFIPLRKELVVQLRGAGDREGARALSVAPKPSVTAWALNVVARQRPEVYAALLAARDLAASTQGKGDADELRESARAYRARVADAVQAASEVLAAAGHGANAVQTRRMGETLQVAIAEPSEARTRLLSGRLVSDVSQEDPLAGLELVPEGAERAARAEGPPVLKDEIRARELERERERQRAALAASVEAAEREVAELETTIKVARAAARVAEVAAARAADDAARARRAADDLEARLREAHARRQAAVAAHAMSS